MKTIFKVDCEYEKISQILENEYINLFNSIQDEGYKLQYEYFDAFVEITDSDKVVGFYSLKQLDSSVFVLTECYIQKEHRGKNLMGRLLEESISLDEDNLYIRNPNYNMIKVLLKNKLAIKLQKNIILSFFNLVALPEDIYKSPRIKGLHRNIKDDEILKSTYYDNNLKTMIAMDYEADPDKNERPIIIIEPRKGDIKKYNFRKKLRSFSSKHIDDRMFDIFNIDEDVVDDFLDETFNRLMKSVPIDDIIMSVDEVDDSLLEEYNLTEDDFLKIREHLKEAVENDEVKRDNIDLRYNYLLENPEKIENKLNLSLIPFKCPFCENNFYPIFDYCSICGFSFDLNNLKQLFEQKDLGENEVFYAELMDKINENNWDYNEILNLQCLAGTVEFIKMSKEDIHFGIILTDRSNKLKSGTVVNYAIENGYVQECSYNDYINIIKNFNFESLIEEAVFYDFNPKKTKNGIINQIKEIVSPDIQSIKHIPTKKGIKLLENSEDILFYLDYLPTFIYCEFKKYLNSHDYSLMEAGDHFVEEQYQKGIKNKDWSAYRKKLKYEIRKSEDITRKVIMSIQLLIYDMNNNENKFFTVEADTAIYLKSFLVDIDKNELMNLFNQAFDEFEINELKHDKDDIYDMLEEMYSSITE